MQDEFINRLNMFTTSLDYLEEDDRPAIWQGQPPEIFTTKVTEATLMVAELAKVQQGQEADITGRADEKEREERELEDAAHELGQALAIYHRDRGEESEAGEVDLTITQWRQLRHQQLLQKSQLVVDRATAASSGATAVDAAKYGITPATVQALVKERGDFEAIVNAPATAIAVRKALTQGFRPATAFAGSSKGPK